MNTELSDEQLGRLWCKRHGNRPDCTQKGLSPRLGMVWRWVCDDGPKYSLPACLWDCLPRKRHDTEADAYAAVGAGLRELKRKADEIAAVLEGVPT